MSVHQDGKQWFFATRYTDENGAVRQYKSKRYRTKREATEAQAEFKVNKKYITENHLIRKLLDEFTDASYATVQPSTKVYWQAIDKYIYDTVADCIVEKFNKADYDKLYLYVKGKHLQDKRKNKIINRFKSFAKYVKKVLNVNIDYTDTYPAFRDIAKPVEKLKYMTWQQFQQYIRLVEGIQFQNLFIVLYLCGLRVSEGNALTFDDVDFKAKTITINKSVNTRILDEDGNYMVLAPKTRSSVRTIQVPDKAMKALEDMYTFWSFFPEFDFDFKVFGGKQHLPDSTIHKVHRKAIEASGLEFVPVHAFRHSCASLLINSGASVLMVSRYLGHESPDITLKTYAHFFDDFGKEVVERMNLLTK